MPARTAHLTPHVSGTRESGGGKLEGAGHSEWSGGGDGNGADRMEFINMAFARRQLYVIYWGGIF